MISRAAAVAATLTLAGCTSPAYLPVTQLDEPEPIQLASVPEGERDADACYGEDITPAVIETVTHQAVVQPAEIASDGSVRVPAVFHTETRQEIVEPRRELWFERICDEELTPDFIASLQRALAARGGYAGPVDGEMTAATKRAIRRYQKPQGLDSAILSLAAARQLGLIEVGRL